MQDTRSDSIFPSKIYIGPVSFWAQMGFGIPVSVFAGIILYYTYRSSAQNQP